MGDETTPQAERIDLRQAIAAAKDFLLGLEKDNLVVGPIKDLVLEEVNYTQAGHWLITLGYRVPSPLENASMAYLAGLRGPRSDVFKVFTVDRNTGKVIGMSMRESRRD